MVLCICSHMYCWILCFYMSIYLFGSVNSFVFCCFFFLYISVYVSFCLHVSVCNISSKSLSACNCVCMPWYFCIWVDVHVFMPKTSNRSSKRIPIWMQIFNQHWRFARVPQSTDIENRSKLDIVIKLWMDFLSARKLML